MESFLVRISLGADWHIEGIVAADSAAQASEFAHNWIKSNAKQYASYPIWVGKPLQPTGYCSESGCRPGIVGLCPHQQHLGWRYKGMA